jgi:hypothetical protein
MRNTETRNASTTTTPRKRKGSGRRVHRPAMAPVSHAPTATPVYPKDSSMPTARPRWSGPAMSIFALMAMLHVRAWLTPRRTFPSVIHDQFGATMRTTGRGNAVAHPAIRTGFRPYSSPHLPA